MNVEVQGMIKYSIYTWDLVWAMESAYSSSIKTTPALSTDSIRPNNQLTRNKESWKRSNSQQIKLYCQGQCTQNPGLREVELEPNSKKGSDKINRQ